MKSDEKVKLVKRRLADGTIKTYEYARKTKQRIGKEPRYHPTSIGALIIDFKLSQEWQSRSRATKKCYLNSLRQFERLHRMQLSELRRRDILAVRDAVAAEKGPAAANHFVKVVGAVMSWAIDRERIETSPAAKIKPLPGGHLEAWTAAQADLAQRHLPEYLRRVVILARYTGQRRGDLVKLDWSAYDGRTIRLKQQKKRREKVAREMVIPVHRTLKAELDAWKEASRAASTTSTRILTTERGLPWDGDYLSSLMAQRLAKIEGFPPDLNIHGLRKLAAASLAEAGCSAHEIAAITGHETLAMVEFYTKSADQQRLASAAISRLENDAGKRNGKRR